MTFIMETRDKQEGSGLLMGEADLMAQVSTNVPFAVFYSQFSFGSKTS